MRNIRNAAVAAIAASAIALTGANAVAQENTTNQTPNYSQLEDFGKTKPVDQQEVNEALKKDIANGGSSHIGKVHGSDQQVTGVDLLGSSVDKNAANWAKIWRDGTTVGVIGGILGFIVAAFNLAKYQGLIPHNFPF